MRLKAHYMGITSMGEHMGDVFISLGSNSHHAQDMLCRAQGAIQNLAGIPCKASSPVYHTEPQELKHQAWFYNMVLHVECSQDWSPQLLMSAFLDIEHTLGRVRDKSTRYGARCIDIDMLLYDTLVCHEPHCILPHPRLLARAFMLIPLHDIDPWRIITDGISVHDALQRITYRVEGYKIYQ